MLTATRALVRKGGYAAATIDAVAARSGVAKTTIYRWWPNRAALVVDVLARLSAEAVPIATGGEPLAALHTEMRLIAGLGDAPIGRLMTALLADAQEDPEVRRALVEGLFDPRRRAMAAVVTRAQQAGRIRADVPPLVVVDLLVGPIFYRMFVRHEPLTAAFARQVFENELKGLAPPSRRTARTGHRPSRNGRTAAGRSRRV